MEAMIEYRWPGNIRELRNVLERAIIFCDDEVIDIGHLPQDVVHPVK
jgi:DNA-binding NtrC family response regulator